MYEPCWHVGRTYLQMPSVLLLQQLQGKLLVSIGLPESPSFPGKIVHQSLNHPPEVCFATQFIHFWQFLAHGSGAKQLGMIKKFQNPPKSGT